MNEKNEIFREKHDHAGHRKRFRERFLKTGLDGFAEHEALELLLSYGIPRKNVNPLAHKLIKHFGSFHGVFDASVEDLKNVEGIGESAAILIKLVLSLNRQCEISRTKDIVIINSTEKAGKFLVPKLSAYRDEVVYMLCLDSKLKVLSCKEMFKGSVNSANINMRKLVENAFSSNAVNVILAHNHLSGVKQPSREDVETTRRVAAALSAVDIRLTDHIIVVGEEYVSMADEGYI